MQAKTKEDKIAFLHGILLIVLFSFSAFYIAGFDFVKKLSLSPLIVGIILGMVYANTLRSALPAAWAPGIKFCSKQILRLGVILYGFRLTLQQVFEIGLPAIVVDIIIVCGTLCIGVLVGKLLKTDSQTALMTSVGSAICGAAREFVQHTSPPNLSHQAQKQGSSKPPLRRGISGLG